MKHAVGAIEMGPSGNEGSLIFKPQNQTVGQSIPNVGTLEAFDLVVEQTISGTYRAEQRFYGYDVFGTNQWSDGHSMVCLFVFGNTLINYNDPGGPALSNSYVGSVLTLSSEAGLDYMEVEQRELVSNYTQTMLFTNDSQFVYFYDEGTGSSGLTPNSVFASVLTNNIGTYYIKSGSSWNTITGFEWETINPYSDIWEVGIACAPQVSPWTASVGWWLIENFQGSTTLDACHTEFLAA